MTKASLIAHIQIITIIIFSIQTAQAQFFYEKVEESFGYEFEKPIELYGKPRYNRVEGLFLNLGARIRPKTVPNLLFHSEVGFGFWNENNKQSYRG